MCYEEHTSTFAFAALEVVKWFNVVFNVETEFDGLVSDVIKFTEIAECFRCVFDEGYFVVCEGKWIASFIR